MRVLVAVSLVVVALAGCTESPAPQETTVPGTPDVPILGPVVKAVLNQTMQFSEHVVDAAIGYASDLYEPTMDVCDDGSIYVTGHTILVDTTGAPVFGSHDDGQTWEQLPFLLGQTMPGDIHGATPPPSDEIFLSCGDDGWLYGVDITAATFPINAWADHGMRHAYHNPNGYDRVSSTASVCAAAGLNDRPWGAYANGKLFLVNNPGGGSAPLGRAEIGIMDVPPAVPAGIGNPVTGPTWNFCPTVGGSIPGIPDMRDDHLFAAPQVHSGKLTLVMGNANDIFDVRVVEVFPNTNTGGGTSNGGQAQFDAKGNLFVAIRNNTQEDRSGNRTGQLHLAVSTDDGKSFVEQTLVLSSPATSLYIDGNKFGPGALLTWAQIGEAGTDWYAAHLFVGPDGGPMVTNINLVVDEGTSPSAHVQGAAVGPDGRAYLVTFHGGYSVTDRATPLHVHIQRGGPTMPLLEEVVAVAMG